MSRYVCFKTIVLTKQVYIILYLLNIRMVKLYRYTSDRWFHNNTKPF